LTWRVVRRQKRKKMRGGQVHPPPHKERLLSP
jgi:hypothetical protein